MGYNLKRFRVSIFKNKIRIRDTYYKKEMCILYTNIDKLKKLSWYEQDKIIMDMLKPYDTVSYVECKLLSDEIHYKII